MKMMNQQQTDEKYMRRCLQLARGGRQNAKPNPMVGAVIVWHDRIIGEGYHVRCGEGHAEVNAFASVRPEDEAKLRDATIYVSLEPCSHFGRTPPCADLIVSKGVRRAVVGCVDPFARVHGRGIQRLRDAGIEVTVGVLERECLALNSRFVTFNTHSRPYILLKWAQSANGFLDDRFCPVRLSTPFTQMLVHKLRAESDAILVGHVTDEREHPQLNVREWEGPDPKRIVLSHDLPHDSAQPLLPQLMTRLHDEGIQSLLVEGGGKTFQSFLDASLWDEIRIETAPCTFTDGTRAPQTPFNAVLAAQEDYDGNIVRRYLRSGL